ncbi:hypothetical protein SASC598O11_012820 [Snodgrassella alvi SCGC AB-598-O11]|nr:hypothetical protein SASC598O11_012820 [Snodgrassella alvi SCGC AB-598-O11]
MLGIWMFTVMFKERCKNDSAPALGDALYASI